MTDLRVREGSWEHRLSLALRFDDHFLGTPIPEPLQVTLASPQGRWLLPLGSPTAGVLRQNDGTYRFADVGDGNYPVACVSPSGDWVSWEPPLTITLPLSPANPLLVRQLWPTPRATVAAGATVVRGKLVGALVAGLRIEITGQGQAFDGHFNRADATGEFLYPVLMPVAKQVAGQLCLTARLEGGARVVASVDVIDGDTVSTTAGADFAVYPAKASRVKFTVM